MGGTVWDESRERETHFGGGVVGPRGGEFGTNDGFDIVNADQHVLGF